MTITDAINNLLEEMGSGLMSSSAYDTAWVARLGDIAPDLSTQAVDWLREHQLPDGSWGEGHFVYNHDRLMCTLAAINALATVGSGRDRARIEKAAKTIPQWTNHLKDDPAEETIGFELIVPTLFEEAITYGLIEEEQVHQVLMEQAAQRTPKLSRLPNKTIRKDVTVAFSAELVGQDAQALLDKEKLQEANGSVSCSPSASAFLARYIKEGDVAALNFIRRYMVDGGLPNIPIDVFERAWILWNLELAGFEGDENLIEPHLEALSKAWITGVGIGANSECSLVDADDSSVVLDVFVQHGLRADMDVLMGYETDTHFQCYPLERNPSISTNIHILSAFSNAEFHHTDARVQKILTFLRQNRVNDAYWYDKWHVSPYYPTSHAVLAGMHYAPDLFAPSIQWMLDTQNEDGSWGFYVPTTEETSYCLQTLMVWMRTHTLSIQQRDKIQKGIEWLHNNATLPSPGLWIGKSLYRPIRVIEATVLSTLYMAEKIPVAYWS